MASSGTIDVTGSADASVVAWGDLIPESGFALAMAGCVVAPCFHRRTREPFYSLAHERALRWCPDCKRYVQLGHRMTMGDFLLYETYHVSETPLP